MSRLSIFISKGIFLFGLVAVSVAPAVAHPVAQGSLKIVPHSGALAMDLSVAVEQILVYEQKTTTPAATLDEAVQRHGDYLLEHLQVQADGLRLKGTLVSIQGLVDGAVTGPFIRYHLSYPTTKTPRQIQLRQDFLREFEYAPGNRWEASFVTELIQEGDTDSPVGLLEWRQPLDLDTALPASGGTLVREYLLHGILHILSGYDHLLFILALMLFARRWSDLVVVVSVFTLAHTLTLALSFYHVVRLPGVIVEPMIAASIVGVSLLNIFKPQPEYQKARLFAAFAFGLFHGLGFAGGLLEAMSSLGATSGLLALGAFACGVEIGHQLVVLPTFALLLLLTRWFSKVDVRRATLSYGSWIIAAAGLYYFFLAINEATTT